MVKDFFDFFGWFRLMFENKNYKENLYCKCVIPSDLPHPPKIINEDKSQALCLHYFSAWASLEKM